MNWLVIGAGVTGVAAARWLAQQGHHVRLSEAKTIADDLRQTLVRDQIEVVDGGHELEHLQGIDKVVPSPGLPHHHPLMEAAKEKFIPMISEIDLALGDYGGKLFGITGTNGKSTIASMIAHLIARLGEEVALVGNIGMPPSEVRRLGELPDYVVAELSSYQLEQSVQVTANIGIFPNFSDDHLAHHGDRKSYFLAKWSLLERMSEEAIAIVGADVCKEATQYGLSTKAKLWTLVEKEPSDFEFALLKDHLHIADECVLPIAPAKQLFPHNQLNAAIALVAVAKGLDYPVAPLVGLLADFKGLPHRCEIIGTWQGRRVIEDSKATNVDSVLVALSGLQAPSYLLLGGQPKGESFQPIIIHKDRIKAVLAFGEAAPAIHAQLAPHIRTTQYSSLADAIASLDEMMRVDAAQVLFSPGCASFDEYTNFSARGDAFQSHVAPFMD